MSICSLCLFWIVLTTTARTRRTTTMAFRIVSRGIRRRVAILTSAATMPSTTTRSSTVVRGGGNSFPTIHRCSMSASASAAATAMATPRSENAQEEFLRVAKAAGYSDVEAWMTAGGDCRTIILPQSGGTNKYHIAPQPIGARDIFRGSCTGNPPTARGLAAAQALYEQEFAAVINDPVATEQALRRVFAQQRDRIAKVLQLPEGTEIVLCPSGSDAEYIPLLLARTLRPDISTLAVGVAQVKEVGAGTAPAAAGQYFSTHAPLLGKLNNDDDNNNTLAGLDGIVETCIVPARQRNGSVLDASTEMEALEQQALQQQQDDDDNNKKYPITHGVFGGKTGLRCARMPGSRDAGRTSLGVVDACQGRFTQAELQQWLQQDSVVLYTSSKFYQAPPFAGAVLIPPAIAEQVKACGSSSNNNDHRPDLAELLGPSGLGGFLTDKEVPESFTVWTKHLASSSADSLASLSSRNNIGLALRWEAGLAAMEALADVSDHDKDAATNEWAARIQNLVASLDDSPIDVWCVERSIVSLRVAKSSSSDEWRSMAELRKLFAWMSVDLSDFGETPEEARALATTAYTGQPVDVSDSFAIIRVALGAECMLALLNDNDRTEKEKHMEQDALVIQKIAALAKHFDAIDAKLSS